MGNVRGRKKKKMGLHLDEESKGTRKKITIKEGRVGRKKAQPPTTRRENKVVSPKSHKKKKKNR